MAELKQKEEELSILATMRKELLQPFIDVWNAPRALWGVNLSYVLEGLVYFGMLGYLAMHFSDFIFGGMESADEWSHSMVAVLTAGITISMVLLGWVCDKYGVRKALIGAFVLLLAGRVLISAAPTVLGMEPAGLWSPLHLTTMGGILLVVIGYGLYQPSAYAAVRQFTTPKTAAMGFAMLYALMNLGGYIPSFAFLLRDEDYAGLGITGTFWVYTGVTVVALVATVLILSRKTVETAIATAKAETERIKAEEEAGKSDEQKAADKAAAEAALAFATEDQKLPWHTWLVMLAIVAVSWWRLPPVWAIGVTYVMVAIPWVAQPYSRPIVNFVARHPLGDLKFFFFIFALIPVQTLFTYNWLVLPQYIDRAFTGWIGEYFELTANLNPILIFLAVPIIAALTRKSDTYKMMIIGTFIMAAPAFLLVLGPHWWTIFPYIFIMTIGEAMWQPRFLQYAAEIAPEGRTGEYMGVAQLPWFLTKLLAPLLITGWTLQRFCPADTPVEDLETGKMWLIYASIAMTSTVLLLLARNWIGSSIQTASK
jgi:POT family proton-dependent oligopeptide transporter